MSCDNRRAHHGKGYRMLPGGQKAKEAPKAQLILHKAAAYDVNKSKARNREALGGQKASPNGRHGSQTEARNCKDA